MDQVKIGRFIAERRKMMKLTQSQLAEKLDITDRAVSKWETGKSLPDSSIMLCLCDILGISVNELLTGEVITMDNYNKEMENKLIEMVKEKEAADKRLLTLEWVIGGLSCIILLAAVIVASYAPIEEWKRVLIAFGGMVPSAIGFFFALIIEQVAGYYECGACKHRYVPTFMAVNMAMHMGRTRYMRCPQCGKKTWQKKVISKD